MDYAYLKAFIFVGKHLNFTKAGKELGLTQAAISRQIKQLEISIGEQLVIRSPKMVKLTPRGLILWGQAQSLYKFVEQEFRGKQERHLLNIGVIQGALENWLIEKLATHFQDDEFCFNIMVNVTDVLFERLLNGQLDLVITARKIETGILSSRFLFEENFVLISKKEIDQDKLEQYRWIVHGASDHLLKLKRKSKNILTLNSLPGIIKMVEHGYGIAVVPEHAVIGNKKIQKINLKNIKKGAIYLTCYNYEAPPRILGDFLKKIS